MKKLVLLLGLCGMLGMGLHAQAPYKPCLDGEARWSILCEMLDYGKFSLDLVTDEDTTINNKPYKKIMTMFSWEPTFYNFADKYIRETEDASRLYVYDERTGQEYRISDLNMKVGDTYIPSKYLYTAVNNWSLPEKLTVDSVYLKDGLKHIQFDYTIPPFYELASSKVTFIESIGPNVGLWTTSDTWCGWQELNCFHNQSLPYKNENMCYPCGYQVPSDAIPAIASEEDYTIRSNENGIEINRMTDADVQISIYDIYGKRCYSIDFAAGKIIAIPTASFPRGVYLLRILYEKQNKTSVRKIVL
jgi:hypothetical protein